MRMKVVTTKSLNYLNSFWVIVEKPYDHLWSSNIFNNLSADNSIRSVSKFLLKQPISRVTHLLIFSFPVKHTKKILQSFIIFFFNHRLLVYPKTVRQDWENWNTVSFNIWQKKKERRKSAINRNVFILSLVLNVFLKKHKISEMKIKLI